jgi:hypothetical protein
VKRIYNPDDEEWSYGAQGLKGLYSASVIDFRKTERMTQIADDQNDNP